MSKMKLFLILNIIALSLAFAGQELAIEPVAWTGQVVAEMPKIVHADTIDGVVFTVRINREAYEPGDTMLVRFGMKNQSMGTVVYDFSTSCQFELQIMGSRGNEIYSFLEHHACEPQPSRITLAHSEEKTTAFPPVCLEAKRGDSLRVQASMAGYPLSAVSIKAIYDVSAGTAGPMALEGSIGRKPVLEFNHDTRMLIIRVDRGQRLSISAFVLTGKKVNKMSCEKYLAPGTHRISFNNRKLADGVVVFKVEGSGFSESKTINLSR